MEQDQLQRCVVQMKITVLVGLVLVLVTSTMMMKEMNLFLAVSDSLGYRSTQQQELQKQQQPQQPLIILVQLSGEFGNHLSKIAYGRALQLWLQEEYGVTKSKLVLRHQGKRYEYKWLKTQAQLQRCFPWTTTSLNFAEGNDDPVYEHFVQQYTLNRTSPFYRRFDEINMLVGDSPSSGSSRISVVAQTLRAAVNAYHKQEPQQQYAHGYHNVTSKIPFILYSTQFVHGNHFFLERYYNEFRKMFEMSLECCPVVNDNDTTMVPSRDETVVHLRNYLIEMPRKKGKTTIYEEANPYTMANRLLSHLQPDHDKVVLLGPTAPGRFRNNATAVWHELQAHAHALQRRSIATRIINHTDSDIINNNSSSSTSSDALVDMRDFCFLLRAQRELVGLETSTFVYWAAILGQAQSVRLYTIVPRADPNVTDTTGTVVQTADSEQRKSTHFRLSDRIQFIKVEQHSP
ncbi:hypothetical protein ACA910_020187 [Epithemia clementina (nom. ined.)]